MITITPKMLRQLIAEESQLDKRPAALSTTKAAVPTSSFSVADRKRVQPPPKMPVRKEPSAAKFADTEMHRLIQRFASSWADQDLEGEDPVTFASDVADQFFDEVPQAMKLVQDTWTDEGRGITMDDVKAQVADAVYDVLMRDEAVYDVGTMRAPNEPNVPSAAKATYKIYGKKAGQPAHTRLKGQVYLAPSDTQFKNGEQANIEPSDGKLRVKKVGSDHEQLWDPE